MKNRIHFLGHEKNKNSLTLPAIAIDMNDKRTVVDPGKGMIVNEEIGSTPYAPNTSSIQDGKSIDQVFLSHGHMDHVAYTPALCNQEMLSSEAKIRGTVQTNEILELMAWDDLRKGTTDFNTIDAIELSSRLQEFKTGENIIDGEPIYAVPNGHMPGSRSFMFRTPSGRIFLFFGDACWHDQATVQRGLWPSEYPKEWIPDEMTTDLTYASGNMGEEKTYEQKKEEFIEAVREELQAGNTVVVQGFASVKLPNAAHDLAAAGIPCFVDSPMAWKILDLYSSKRSSDRDNIILAPGNGVGIYTVGGRNHRRELMEDNESKVVLATGGMGDFGPVLDWYDYGLPRYNFSFFPTSWLAPGSNGGRLIDLVAKYPEWQGNEENRIARLRFQGKTRNSSVEWRNIPVQAKVKRFGMSSHALFGDLIHYLTQLIDIRSGRPLERIFLVHGTAEAKERAKKELKIFAKEVIDPEKDLPDHTAELI